MIQEIRWRMAGACASFWLMGLIDGPMTLVFTAIALYCSFSGSKLLSDVAEKIGEEK